MSTGRRGETLLKTEKKRQELQEDLSLTTLNGEIFHKLDFSCLALKRPTPRSLYRP